MAAHLNINTLRYKFDEIKEVLTENIVDLLIISETKLDYYFKFAQYQLSDDVDKRWYSSTSKSMHLM
jgi:peptide subunit release factor 1 (eRF1)